MNDYAYIYDTARSASRTLGGGLSSVRPDDKEGELFIACGVESDTVITGH